MSVLLSRIRGRVILWSCSVDLAMIRSPWVLVLTFSAGPSSPFCRVLVFLFCCFEISVLRSSQRYRGLLADVAFPYRVSEVEVRNRGRTSRVLSCDVRFVDLARSSSNRPLRTLDIVSPINLAVSPDPHDKDDGALLGGVGSQLRRLIVNRRASSGPGVESSQSAVDNEKQNSNRGRLRMHPPRPVSPVKASPAYNQRVAIKYGCRSASQSVTTRLDLETRGKRVSSTGSGG